jgi:hypothetical protein
MSFFVVSKFKSKFNLKDQKLLFLLTINIVPILLMFLTSMIMGVKIRTMWTTSFYLFFGVLLVYIFQTQINLKKLKGFVSVFLILFIFSPFAYAYISITKTDKRTDYPGKQIAEIVEKKWDPRWTKFEYYVGNDEWHAGNLSYHLKSRPVVLINKIAADKKFYYPFLLEIYNFTPETKCSKTKWQLRKAIIEVNKQKLLICY